MTVKTTGVGQATAIANIKNLLNQNQPVAYSYYLPTEAGWTDFQNFWDSQSESTLWSPDAYSGKTWDSGGGGHQVTIVGYDDSASNAASRYWIVLNSWGTSSKRPNGVFRLAQQINYDAYFKDGGTKYDSNIFEALTVTWAGTTALSISSQPTSATVAAGQPALFKVVAAGGTSPFTYQWRKGGAAISGATSASYSIASVVAADAGSYDVVVKDAAGASVTSQAATLTVTSCTPSCTGKACGSDGCGGSCGTCSGSTSCDTSGQCVGGTCAHPTCSTGTKLVSGCDACVTKICAADSYCCSTSWDSTCVKEVATICGQSCTTCTPSCSGKTCGSDGCGGTCGTCATGSTCSSSGQCVASCTPSCSGKTCGADGCGGTCGTCSGGTTCSSGGQCEASCTPSCGGKACGDDGCGGTCGSCASGMTCSTTGQCVTPTAAGTLVINEVSTRGATASDETIELYNGTGADLSLAGYRLYYRAAGTTSGNGTLLVTFASTAKIPAGKHFLLGGAGYTGSVAADATFSSGIADAGGSVWLFKAAPASVSKTDASFVDLVGWGTAASANYEGAGAAPAPSTAYTSCERKSAVDTGNNAADLALVSSRTLQNSTM
ncbi:MAG: lamin tail domain-containing protein [Myxococcales bacterium]